MMVRAEWMGGGGPRGPQQIQLVDGMRGGNAIKKKMGLG
jgi:hypothetical protein